eukprot:gene5857-9685_t
MSLFTSSVSESDPDLLDLQGNEDEIECPICKGEGKYCAACHNKGLISNVYKTCFSCEGKGKQGKKKCFICQGNGICQKEWKLCLECKGTNSTDCKNCSGKGYTIPEGILDINPKF